MPALEATRPSCSSEVSSLLSAGLPVLAPRVERALQLEVRRPAEPQSEAPGFGAQEEALLVRRAQRGDAAAREKLVQGNLRLVHSVARKYRCRRLAMEDLIQEGIVGLITAIERFDGARGCRLSTYAVHWIRQNIARAVEQNDRLIRVPVQASVQIRQIQRLREDLLRSLNREPTEAEMAQASGLTEERISYLLHSAQDAISLETLVGEEEELSLVDMAEDPEAVNPEEDLVSAAYRQQLRVLVEGLCPRERQVLEERYGFGGRTPRSLQEVSAILRISREGVRQIELRAMRKLRQSLRQMQWD